MLAPITPHICEDLWNKFYGEEDIELSWPDFDEDITLIEEFELIIQINGKVRGKLNIKKDTNQKDIELKAIEVENVKSFINNSKIKKTIYVKDKLINFVI